MKPLQQQSLTPQTIQSPSGMPTVITSRTNARVKQLRAAFEGRLPDTIAIEGEHLLLEALRSDLALHTLYLREDTATTIPLPPHIETLYLGKDVFQSIAATENTQGIAAILHPPTLPLPAHPTLLLIADTLRDPGNMGTLIRSAEAFNADAILTTPGTVDPWNQKSLRASAGSIFRTPVIPTTTAQLHALKAAGIQLLAAVPTNATAAPELDLTIPTALILGNEATGISPPLLALADAHITVPCPGPVESLNAAIAGSLLLYEAARQRARTTSP